MCCVQATKASRALDQGIEREADTQGEGTGESAGKSEVWVRWVGEGRLSEEELGQEEGAALIERLEAERRELRAKVGAAAFRFRVDCNPKSHATDSDSPFPT